MGERAEYKSSIRSRMLIRRAFVELWVEKEIDRITVTDIVKRAQINRGTFYAHYQDTRAVAEQIEDDITAKLRELLPGGLHSFYSDPKPFLRSLADFLSEDRLFYAALVCSNGLGDLQKKLAAAYSDILESDRYISPETKLSPEFLARHIYISSGVYNLYREWLTGGLSVDAETLSTLAAAMTCSLLAKDEFPGAEKD